jgi:membrane protease YdiL (CAAX protease family)
VTALVAAGRAGPDRSPASLARPFALVGALVAVVAGRWAAWQAGALDPIAVGALFGAALLTVGVAAGWRPSRPSGASAAARAAGLGAAAGVLLALTALVGPHPSWAAAYAAGLPAAPWAAATVLVAAAEEVVLRGALFAELLDARGVATAVVATSTVFALMHVPVYGWRAVPLDLGVGLVFAGLRLLTGGVAAPAVAHALADLAVAWL